MWVVALAMWSASACAQPVLLVSLDGAIGPATANLIHRALERAQREEAQLLILEMDTPGGLDTSMRVIIRDILSSRVPVATYVAPSGARAASAGTFILYASHVAAMAPATNLGAASPVAIGGQGGQDKSKGSDKESTVPSDTLARKQMHDAAAYIRGLAQLRGRNADWAERAVREAVSLSATDALDLKVIDLLAPDVTSLLKALDGRKIEAGGATRTLRTADVSVTAIEIDWRTRLLAVITNPSVAYLLVLVGIYALIFEFANPGLILPGVAGAICVILALYSFHLLPVNYAGLGLIVLGIAFMIAEAFVPAFGSLGIGGLIAFVLGSLFLFDSDIPEFDIPYGLIAGVSVGSAALLCLALGMAIRGRRQPVVSGREAMIGETGVAQDDFASEGWMRIQGELWRCRSTRPVRRGQRLRVGAMEGLTLIVDPEPEG